MGNLQQDRPGRSMGPSNATPSDVFHLRRAAAAWRLAPPADQASNRQFLALFAVYLVKHFRSEEDRLERIQAPDRRWHQSEHQRLVRQIDGLMARLLLGMEVSAGIQAFLEDWQFHQDAVDASGHQELLPIERRAELPRPDLTAEPGFQPG